MPFYEFKCEKCEHKFELYQQMSSYSVPETCPSCTLPGTVIRLYDGCPSFSNGEPKTLGALADRNASKFTDEQKAILNAKHTAYLRNRAPPTQPRINYDKPSRPRKHKNR